MSEKAKEAQVAESQAESEQPQGEQPQSERDEIKFQRIMEYKAYRRGMYLKRLAIALILVVGLAFTGYISLFFGIVLPISAFIIVVITILASMGNEQTYTVYTTRVVLKKRGDDKRASVPLDSIVSVKYKSAWYEKRMCVGTVTITANTDGKTKKYKMKHILDAKPIVQFLNDSINGGNNDGGQDGE